MRELKRNCAKKELFFRFCAPSVQNLSELGVFAFFANFSNFCGEFSNFLAGFCPKSDALSA
jgi:hypothetical protein